MKRFDKILIANRGEIACRVLRTCHAMGIGTVAVFSDADEGAPFVRLADEAVRIGPPASAESYLRIDRILEAAARTGADAVHPGYGFLAENADFAAACADAGLTFIGPSPDAIRLLGSKKASKERVAAAGVPVIPSFDPGDPASMEFPVLLKASAGGGGKGMRIVRRKEDFAAALESAQREARSSFGDDTMLVERYVEAPRHVEIQILGDAHGNLLHLFERECSIQRRHQKIIEESPSPALTPELRERMGAAAVAVGQAAGYVNAGTVEFILAPDGAFYFLEVNTRLQVEHPVTEMVTGLDLVREQIRVAQGERLGYAQDDLGQRGAAIECRLYAEDADAGFLPQSGTIVDWHLPDQAGLRVDTGVEAGSVISIHYDPMIAKIVTHAPTRAEAIAAMRRALGGLSCRGVVTNRDFLGRVLAHPGFQSGEIDTHFLDDRADELRAPGLDRETLATAALAATLAAHEQRRAERSVLPQLEPGFRNNPFADQEVRFTTGDGTLAIGYRNLGDGRFRVRVDDDEPGELSLVRADDSEVVFERDGLRRTVRTRQHGDRWLVLVGGRELELREEPRFPDRTAAGVEGGCVAPMPGKVVAVSVEVGAAVSRGDTLMVLEAMKMEHRVTADRDGVVTELRVAVGDQVDADQLLAVVGDA